MIEATGYTVVFEQGGPGDEPWGAYVPDLPGCVTTGDTLEEARMHIREAIAGHIAALRETGQPVPPATSRAEQVTIAA